MPAVSAPCRGLLSRFVRDRNGIGAVEFALIAPVLLIIYLGGAEAATMVTLSRKVQHAGATVNDLVTQSGTLSGAEIKGILNIAGAIVSPYDGSKLRIRILQIAIDDKGKATVDWPCGTTGVTLPKKGDSYTLPSQFSSMRSANVVVADTAYDYRPLSGYVFKSKFTFGSTSYLNPRIGSKVTSSGC